MKISVALCTYNGGKYIEEQINSILNQSVKVDEIIVCDDQSKDDTLLKLKKLQTKNTSISIIENDINLRSTKNFEKAISLCTGDYIFLSDQDDLWNNLKVEKTIAVFNENPTAEGVFSNASLIDENNNIFTDKTIWDSVFFFENELIKPIDFFDIIAKNGNVVTGATLCIKKSVKEFIFPFTEDVLHDEKIATLLALRETLFYSTENLISYRLHDKQQVGMKNIDKIEKKNKLRRIVLGLEKANTFNEYRLLSKKIYLKLDKSKKIVNSKFIKTDIQNLILKSKFEWEDIITKMKFKFPIRFRLVQFCDKILDKRKT